MKMSAQTAARAPAAQPHTPPCRSRQEFPARAARLPPWGYTTGGSRRDDTSPEAGRPAASAARSATDLPAPRSSAHPDRERPCSTATFNNALVNRLADLLHRRRRCHPNHVRSPSAPPARISPSRSRDLLRVAPLGLAPLGFSAVAIDSLSCTAVSSTGTAFPCPPVLDPARSTGITPPSSTTRSSDFCWAIESSSSRSLTYRLFPAGAQQISQGKTLRFRRDRVATTPSATTGTGPSPLRDSSPNRGPPYGASLSFATTTHLWLSSRPALTEAPAAPVQAALGTARSIPGRALASSMSGSPWSGSRDRTSTSDLIRHAWHTRLLTPLAYGSGTIAGRPRN